MAFSQGQQNGGNGVGAGRGGARKHIKHEDQEEGKLFVGGLSWETTQDSLLRYFSHYGEVIDCVVMKNAETGRSRGFGFVTFSDPNNIDSVIQSCPHNLDGRTIDPKPCNPRSMQKPKKNINWPKVFLGGLPSSITETDLRNYFSRYGRVTEVVIMYDQEKKKARGFGFLSFESDAAVDQAVSEHYVNIQNKQVEIKRAEPRNNPDSVGSASNGPVVDQWGAPPSNGISQTGPGTGTPTYSGWGAPPAPPTGPPISVSMNYQSQPSQWGAPPHSQPSPVQHSWGAPPHQNNFAHAQQAPPPPHTPQYNSNHYAAPAPHIGTSYWGSPPGPTPPPSTPGDLYAPTGPHAAPPQSPSQHKYDPYTSQHAFQLGPPTPHTPHTDYSRMYQATKGPHQHHTPPAHYSSPTSPDYYSPQCAPLPSYPPNNNAMDQRVPSNHHHNGPYAPQLSQVFQTKLWDN